jgi:hypothetical protein
MVNRYGYGGKYGSGTKIIAPPKKTFSKPLVSEYVPLVPGLAGGQSDKPGVIGNAYVWTNRYGETVIAQDKDTARKWRRGEILEAKREAEIIAQQQQQAWAAQQAAAYEAWRQEQLRLMGAYEGELSAYEKQVLGWKIPRAKITRMQLSPASRRYLTRPQRIQYLKRVRGAEAQRSEALSNVARARQQLAEERRRIGL